MRDGEVQVLKKNISKNTRDLKGRSKMVKGGMRIRGNGKAEILNQPVWEDLNFPEEATEIPNNS